MSEPSDSVPRASLKERGALRWHGGVFLGLAALSLGGCVASTAARLPGGKLEQAKVALEAEEVGGPARSIVGPQRGGGTYDLGASRGKLVLVNFWATWCPPCREEMPSIERLAQQMDPSTFELVAVSVDEAWPVVDAFFEGKATTYPVVLDPKGERFSIPYGTSIFPETYLVDAAGNLKLKFIGPRDWSDENVFVLLEQLGAKRAEPKRR